MTTMEYFATPESLLPTELIFGQLFVAKEAPTIGHQRVVFRLARVLAAHVESGVGGEVLIAPVDVVLDADRALILQPDVLYIGPARGYVMSAHVDGAPDIAVEVLSPRPRIGNLKDKLQWYAEYGTREIWVLDQQRQLISVYTGDGRQIVERKDCDFWTPIESRVLPGFSRSLTSMFGPKV